MRGMYIFAQIAGFCNATWDGFLCWPLTPAGSTPRQPCPAAVKGILRDSKLAERALYYAYRVTTQVSTPEMERN